ncbi:MAG: hypothetical protein IJT05_00480 [Lachnospiraceae bacterium]|nr:hypothetical protein [Lachnospiraceae bacterium]
MFRRLSYIDPETGFYNEKYLAVMERKAAKKIIAEKYIELVSENCEKEGIAIESSYEMTHL